MTVGGRVCVALGSTIAGALIGWAFYHTGVGGPIPARLAPRRPTAAVRATGGATLWVFSIGVSRYARQEWSLQFADLDARAIAAAFLPQADGPLYQTVRTLVLTNEEVTRESILDGMGRFLGQAGPRDVVVIFVAGHGVFDRASGSYYFLTFPASADNLVTAGLRMSDFDEMVRMLRARTRGVVVMVDTCHAGGLQFGSPDLVAMGDPGAGLSVGEGFFLLAASKRGETSQEQPSLGHGAFTAALLEGLQGAADGDRDGQLSVADLFSYADRRVPRLTDGTQHPYHRTEGTDLVLAELRGAAPAVTPSSQELAGSAEATPRPASDLVGNSIGVMQFDNVRADAAYDWVGTALRLAFNTELSKVRALRVYAPELIDRTAKELGTDALQTAQRLGIDRLVTGSFSIVGTTALIDARIVDVGTGLQEGSDSVRGDLDDILDLQKKLVLSLLRRLRVRLSPDEGSSIDNGSNQDVDAYRLLLDTEEAFDEPTVAPAPTPPPSAPPPGPRSQREEVGPPRRAAWAVSGVLALLIEHAVLPSGWTAHIAAELRPGIARAEPTAGQTERAIRMLFEEYQGALQAKDIDRLAALYVSFSPRRREALRDYFANALDYQAEIADVTVMPRGAEVAVSYTRRDRFTDRGTGKAINLEVRLNRIVVREGETWKIRGKE